MQCRDPRTWPNVYQNKIRKRELNRSLCGPRKKIHVIPWQTVAVRRPDDPRIPSSDGSAQFRYEETIRWSYRMFYTVQNTYVNTVNYMKSGSINTLTLI